jgi:hypothetical protein
MTFANLGELNQSVNAYAKRNSVSVIDEINMLADERIRYGSGEEGDPTFTEPVRLEDCMLQTTTHTLTVSTSALTLNTGFLEFVEPPYTIDNGGGRQKIEYISPRKFSAMYGGTGTGRRPQHYTIVGSQMRFSYPGDATYTINGAYFALPQLTTTEQANDLLLTHPSIYLYANLLEVAHYIKNIEDTARYLVNYKSAVAGAMRTMKQRKNAGSTVTPRLDFRVP